MRDSKRRPNLISIGSSYHVSSAYTPSTLNFQGLACTSPLTPPALFDVCPRLSSISYDSSAVQHETHTITAWTGSFNYYKHIPAEIREKILTNLIDHFSVVINKDAMPTTKIHKHLAVGKVRTNLPARYMPSWWFLSHKFYDEARQVMWKKSSVRYERRWDFLSAALQITSSHSIFPIDGRPLAAIRELTINLCRDSDFDGRVSSTEAKRVTTSILQFISHKMPALKTLKFIVDERSKICSSIICFLPDSWFLDDIFRLQQVNMVVLVSGPGLLGSGRKRIASRRCIEALNSVMADHFSGAKTLTGKTSRHLQAKVGWNMANRLKNVYDGTHAIQALVTKVSMLEGMSW